MKVVTLKDIPEVPAPGAAEPTDGYSGPVHRTRQTIIEAGERHWHGAKADTTMGHITITLASGKATWG